MSCPCWGLNPDTLFLRVCILTLKRKHDLGELKSPVKWGKGFDEAGGVEKKQILHLEIRLRKVCFLKTAGELYKVFKEETLRFAFYKDHSSCKKKLMLWKESWER